jgi:hypothetical protein
MASAGEPRVIHTALVQPLYVFVGMRGVRHKSFAVEPSPTDASAARDTCIKQDDYGQRMAVSASAN